MICISFFLMKREGESKGEGLLIRLMSGHRVSLRAKIAARALPEFSTGSKDRHMLVPCTFLVGFFLDESVWVHQIRRLMIRYN